MSHFTTLVIGEDPDKQLDPFSENIEVEPYDEPCYCIRHMERKWVNERMEKFVNIGMVRDAYNEMPENERPDWKKVFYPFFQSLDDSFSALYPNKGSAKKDCEECKGTGITKSTYNKKSKWDWYVLGGRWSGWLKLKKEGKGEVGRPGVLDNKPDEGWVDQAKAGDVDWEETLKKHESTFAVLKNGEWFERGEMGWWGIVRNEKDENAWDEEFKKLVNDLPPETMVSVYDLHI